MYKNLIGLLLYLIFFSDLNAQQLNIDSEKFKDGIYLDFKSFATNTPINFNRLIVSPSKPIREFLSETNGNSEIQYHDDYGISRSIKGKDIWGICLNGNIYIQIGNFYSKLEIVGALSYFTAEIEVQKISPENDFSMGIQTPTVQHQSSYSVEKKQYILNFETGEILETNTTNLLKLLEKDKELYKEFKELNLRDRKKMFFYYIITFNKRNPIQFSANTN